MPAIGDNREQDVVTRFCRTVAFLDGLDAGIEHHLVALEGRGRLGGDDLTCAGGKRRHLHIVPKVLRHHHIREGAEHGDQLRHVDEGGEARHRLVFAGWLQFEFSRDVAEGRSPGVELVQAALKQRFVTEIALHREHLAKRIGDRRAGGQHECPARILRLHEPGFDIKVPGPLGAVRIDTLERRHVGGEAKLPELLGFIDDDLVDTDLGNGEQVVLTGRQRLQPILEPLLQPLKALARDAVVALDLGQQRLVEFQFVVDHLLLECRRHADEAEGAVRDDDRIPSGGGRPCQEAMSLV